MTAQKAVERERICYIIYKLQQMNATLDNNNLTIFNSWENVGFLEYIKYCNDSQAGLEY